MPVFASATEVAYFESRWQLADAFSELKKIIIFSRAQKIFFPELKKIIIFLQLKKDI